MTQWPSSKARRVFAALLGIGWSLKRQSGSHRTLKRDGWPDFVFAFHSGPFAAMGVVVVNPWME